jgi:anaerobic selenocysteine-containing dehydrogenase
VPPTATTDSSRTVYRACPLCEATCGIAVEVTGDRVTKIRGDEDDPFSRGYLCPKAHGLIGLQEDPDRLQRPVRRDGGRWIEMEWDEAFALVAERLRAVRDEHGAGALGAYVGNPIVHDLGASLFLPALLRSLGSKKRFSASSVDQLPKMLSSAAMFGGGLTVPIPDVDHTSHLLMLGANPLASNGSLMTAPDMRGRLRALRQRGGRLVVIDPRRSETAEIADEHHFIRPGSDALFLFSLVHTLFEEELGSLGRLAEFTNGVDTVRELARAFSPEATAATTGIAAAETRRIARDFAAAESAVCYGRIGTCTQEFGTLASWLVDVVNVLTGNLDRRGGAMFTRSATSSGAPRTKRGGKAVDHARWRSSVRGLPESFGELPVAALAEEIDSAGDEHIRALITVAGNPVLSTQNGARLAKALESLDFMVSVDLYVNETTRFADVILPPTSPLERSHYDIAFMGLAVRNNAKFSPAALPAPADSPQQWEILARIAGGLNGVGPDVVDDLVLGAVLKSCVGGPNTACPDVSAEAARAALGDVRGPERILDLMLRAGPYGDRFDPASDGLSLASLREAEHGIDLGPLAPAIPDVLTTESGAVELAPELITADVARLQEWHERNAQARAVDPANGRFLLVGRRHVRSNNSWMHNIASLAKGRDRCTLLVNPQDAQRLGLEDGARARVRSRVGELLAPVALSDVMMPGVVSLPHGYGHDAPGAQLQLARKQAGVNSNLLADEEHLDALSGNAVLNGIPVEIAAAAAEG